MRLRLLSAVTLCLAASGTAFTAAGLSSGVGGASQGKIPAPARPSLSVCLRSSVTVRSSVVTLANLLPDSAPAALRQEAGSVPVGSAPQPAMTRVIYAQQLRFLLQGHKELLAGLTLPSEIVVQRFHRALTKQEVIQAIQSATGQQGITAKDGLDLASARFSTPIYVTEADPGLEVIRIQCDPLRNETRFRLWTSKEPGDLPFEVLVPGAVKLPTLVSRHALAPGEIVSAADFAIVMKPGARVLSGEATSAAELTGLETRASLRPGQPVTRTEFAMPVLVRPGVLATMIVQGSEFRIKTVVTPLEPGVFGQEVKVRNTESRQVVEAKVIGRDRLLKDR